MPFKTPGKAVVLIRPDGSEVEYESQSAASRSESKLRQSEISEMCRLGTKIKGYSAKFKTASASKFDQLNPGPNVA